MRKKWVVLIAAVLVLTFASMAVAASVSNDYKVKNVRVCLDNKYIQKMDIEVIGSYVALPFLEDKIYFSAEALEQHGYEVRLDSQKKKTNLYIYSANYKGERLGTVCKAPGVIYEDETTTESEK